MKTALGIEDEGDVTWEQYVRDTAVKQLAMYVLTAQEAEANGMAPMSTLRRSWMPLWRSSTPPPSRTATPRRRI